MKTYMELSDCIGYWDGNNEGRKRKRVRLSGVIYHLERWGGQSTMCMS